MRKFDLKTKFTRLNRRSALSRHLRDFADSTDGTMTLLTLFLVLIVFTVAGFAVDVMRYDRQRVKLQYALDRAVLAAADLDQELCPREVVRDYLSKEGLDQFLIGEIKVTPETCTTNSDGTVTQVAQLQGKRKVEASAAMNIETHFMKWSGVEYIESVAGSVAEESIGNVEISLVLDVSGSMRGTKLTNLKSAANNFIDEMVAKSEDGRLSMSIVPYSEQVSIPDSLMGMLNTEGSNRFANCLDFPVSEFSTTEFTAFDTATTTGMTIPQTLHHTQDGGDNDYRPSNGFVYSYTCLGNNQDLPSSYSYDSGYREITMLQKDANTLKQRINGMNAYGWTSIDVGLKWGLTLLDDSFQHLASELAKVDAVHDDFKDRPAQNRTTDTLKVVVLMTDGANTEQHMVNPPYHYGTSDIWWNEDDEIYSYYDRGEDNYIWPDVPLTEKHKTKSWYWAREERQDHAYGGGTGTYKQYRCDNYSDGKCYDLRYSKSRDVNEPGGTVELSWPDVWERATRYNIYTQLRDAYGSSYAYNWYYDAATELNQPDKDPRVRSLCAQAEQEEIIVFSIAFEAPSSVKPLLKDCAVEDGRYYEATSQQIDRVFDSIGSTIQNLRLTQ